MEHGTVCQKAFNKTPPSETVGLPWYYIAVSRVAVLCLLDGVSFSSFSPESVQHNFANKRFKAQGTGFIP